MVAALFGLVLVVGSAGGDDGGPRVHVAFDEWTLGTDATSVPAGRVTFAEKNDGKQEHDLLIVRTTKRELPVGLEGVRPSLAGKVVLGREHPRHEHASMSGALHHLGPGRSRRRSVELEPGRYVLICSLPGHYEAGQKSELLVRGAAPGRGARTPARRARGEARGFAA